MAYRPVEAHPVVVWRWWAGARERGSEGAGRWWDRCKHECLLRGMDANPEYRPGAPMTLTAVPARLRVHLIPIAVRITVDQPASGAGVGGHWLSLTRCLSTGEPDMTSWQARGPLGYLLVIGQHWWLNACGPTELNYLTELLSLQGTFAAILHVNWNRFFY